MKIAYTIAPGPGDTDLLLARIAGHLQRRGVRTCGTVQINTDNPCVGRCDMDVKILPDGPVFRISQSLGRNARGCRLDAAALEMSVGHVKTGLEKGAEVLIINKFGKQEAAGGGFREIIAEAFARDIPVLVGLNTLNKPAFEEFAGGLATPVAATESALMAWIEAALAKNTAAA